MGGEGGAQVDDLGPQDQPHATKICKYKYKYKYKVDYLGLQNQSHATTTYTKTKTDTLAEM